MKEVNAAIITIGDELLIGQTIDTNSAFIAQELNKIGIWVKRRIAVGDVKEEILNALKEQGKDCDVIIITGGLGPTADDITKPTLCEFFDSTLVVDEKALQNVKDIFTKLNRPMIERNLKQAEVPDNCIVLQNKRGTAPGMWFTNNTSARPIYDDPAHPDLPEGEAINAQPLPVKDSSFEAIEQSEKTLATVLHQLNKPPIIEELSDLSSPFGGQGAVFISLPGVPHEMKGLMKDSVIPKLLESFDLPAVVHRTLLTSGIGESMIAETISDFETNLPAHIKLAYLPAYGMVRLRLTCRGEFRQQADAEVQKEFDKLKLLVNEWIVADDDITLEEAVNKILKSMKRTLSTAESCTGGYIAHLITSIPGSSSIFYGSIVSYANSVKENQLGVGQETLKEYGAVSEQTVTQMARGALNQLKTDYVIATSGIMGPDGGSTEKPVGTVWIAVANKEKIKTQKSFFRFDRSRNIELAAHTALTMLYRLVKEEEGE